MKRILVITCVAVAMVAGAYSVSVTAAGSEAEPLPSAQFSGAIQGLEQSPAVLAAQTQRVNEVVAQENAQAWYTWAAKLPKPRPKPVVHASTPSSGNYRPGGVNWDGIATCETGGNWSMQGPSFSGGVGFYNGTWNGFGGREFAPNAGMATREQQIIVAERVYARYGLSGWGCRAYG